MTVQAILSKLVDSPKGITASRKAKAIALCGRSHVEVSELVALLSPDQKSQWDAL